METKEEKRYKYGAPMSIILLIGFLTAASQSFGYMEAELLNTYIDHVLNLEYTFIAIMVIFSATMGLIFLFIWGIFSDNTRSKLGRRRPYILGGAVVCGVSLIAFGFSNSYLWCFIIDVIIIGIASNSLYAAQRVLVPDYVDVEHRGRVNSIVNVLFIIGILVPVLLTFIAKESFSAPNPDPLETGVILTQAGHQFLFYIGGGIVIIAGVVGFIFIKDPVPLSELPPKKRFKDELRSTFNIQLLKENKEFFKLIIAKTIYMSGVSAVISYIFNFLFSLEVAAIDYAIILGIAAPFLFIALFFLGKLTDKVGRKKVIPPTILIACVGFIAVPILIETGQLNPVLLGIAFGGILLGLLGAMVPMNTWSQDLLPEEERGKFTGIYNIENTVSQILGASAAAIVATMLTGVLTNPIAGIFFVAPCYFALSIPFFLRVKETLIHK